MKYKVSNKLEMGFIKIQNGVLMFKFFKNFYNQNNKNNRIFI